MSLPLLQVEQLQVCYPLPRRRPWAAAKFFTAVEDLDLQLAAGEILGLVGESGSGKSTTARAIIGLLRPSAGRIILAGEDIAQARGRQWRRCRRTMQMIFQDPYASLDPRLTAAAIIAEPLLHLRLLPDRRQARRRAGELCDRVGLPADSLDRYPHEFSGGQRQRIGIARALAAQPRLLVCDEPVSALDVSVQAQILRLLAELRRDEGLAMLFIAHDLAVVRQLCDRCAVMQAGRIVETGAVERVLSKPTHPYTQSLLAAVPEPDPARARAMLARHRPTTTAATQR